MESTNSQLISEYIEQRNVESLIELCQTLELDSFIVPDPSVHLKYIYDVLLLAYLIEGDLDSARHLCKRTLAGETSVEFPILKALLDKVINLKNEEVLPICYQHEINPHPISNEDSQLMETNEDNLKEWSTEVKPIMSWFIDSFIENRVFALGSTFKTIPMKDASQLIGLDFSKASQSFGWTSSDCGLNWLTCTPSSSKIKPKNHNDVISHFDQVAKMTIRAEL